MCGDISVFEDSLVDFQVRSHGVTWGQLEPNSSANSLAGPPPLTFDAQGEGNTLFSVSMTAISVMSPEMEHARYAGLYVHKSLRQMHVGAVDAPSPPSITAPPWRL
jgi:hypothetical protein